MKALCILTFGMLLAASPALAEDRFALPDLTVVPAKPAPKKPARTSPLAPATSQWSEDRDKPAKSFGEGVNSLCDGCKVSLSARQRPLYPNIGPSPSNWYEERPPLLDDDKAQ